ncbi:MAG: hypothetical protein ACJ8GL_04570, partial [Bacillus sp. (in: firmicutes)]
MKLEDIEQTIGYREDLSKFHHGTFEKNLEVEGYLVLTETDQMLNSVRGIEIINSDNFFDKLGINVSEYQREKDVTEWLSSPYQPLPTVTKATLDLFQYGQLP